MPTTPATRIKIQVNNLTKRFGDLTVLDGINFNIKEGELLAIVGPTGAGKHGLQITDRRHRLDQQTVNTSIEQGVRLFARNAADFTLLDRVLGKPLNTARAHRAQQ